jgi:PhnB protein
MAGFEPVPEHLHTVTPRLVVANGAAAIDVYRAAFGADEIGERFTGPGGELIHPNCESATRS